MKSLSSLKDDLQRQLRDMDERINDAARSLNRSESELEQIRNKSENDLDQSKRALQVEKDNLGETIRKHKEAVAVLEKLQIEIGSALPQLTEAQKKAVIQQDLVRKLDSTITQANALHEKTFENLQKEHKDSIQTLKEEKKQAEEHAEDFERQLKASQEDLERLKRESDKTTDIRVSMARQAAVEGERHIQETRCITQKEELQRAHREEVKELNELHKAELDRLARTIREEHQSMQTVVPQLREIMDRLSIHVNTDDTSNVNTDERGSGFTTSTRSSATRVAPTPLGSRAATRHATQILGSGPRSALTLQPSRAAAAKSSDLPQETTESSRLGKRQRRSSPGTPIRQKSAPGIQSSRYRLSEEGSILQETSGELSLQDTYVQATHVDEPLLAGRQHDEPTTDNDPITGAPSDTTDVVLSTSLTSGDDHSTPQSVSSSMLTPLRPGEADWRRPGVMGSDRKSIVFSQIVKPANWDNAVNQDLIRTLALSKRQFPVVNEDFLDAPLCMPSKLAKVEKEKIMRVDQVEQCNNCKESKKLCWGLRILPGTAPDAKAFKRNQKSARTGYTTNSEGHYWEAIYRPARGPGTDDDDDDDDMAGGGHELTAA